MWLVWWIDGCWFEFLVVWVIAGFCDLLFGVVLILCSLWVFGRVTGIVCVTYLGLV